MRCPRCSTELPAEFKFCFNCGSPLSHTTAPSVKRTFEPPALKTEAPARTSNKPEVEGDSHEEGLSNTQSAEQQPSTHQPTEDSLAAHTENGFVIIKTPESATKGGSLENDQSSPGTVTASFQQKETANLRNNEPSAPPGASSAPSGASSAPPGASSAPPGASSAPSGASSAPSGRHEHEKGRLTSTGSAVAPLGGQPPVTTSERGGRPAGDVSATPVSRGKDNSTPNVRSPAMLESNRLSAAASGIQDKGAASPTSEKHNMSVARSDHSPTLQVTQQQEVQRKRADLKDQQSSVSNDDQNPPNRHVSTSNQHDLATGSNANYTPRSSAPQRKEPETKHPDVDQMNEENAEAAKDNEKDESPAPDGHMLFTNSTKELAPEIVENTTLLLSPQEQKKPEEQHPLSESNNEAFEDDAGTSNKNETETGTWHKKNNAKKDESATEKKSKKERKKEEKARKKAEEQSQSVASSTLKQVEHGVTVVFHVLLVSNFRAEDINLFIRAHGPDLGDFRENCVDMHMVDTGKSKDKERLARFRGEFTLSLDRARRGTFYKYVVVKKGNVHWEYLADFPPTYFYGIVNRYLKISDKHINLDATWNQFDGVTYIYGDQSWLTRAKGVFFKDKTAQNRTKALLCFLPKWKGFLVNESAGEDMIASDALAMLHSVVQAHSNVWVEETGQHRQRKPADFNARTVLFDHLQPKMVENTAILSQSKLGSSAHVSAVVSSLAIILVVKKFEISLQKKDVISLLSCLALEADPTEKKCTVYEAVLKEFSEGFRGFAAEAIENLCNQIMAEAWTFNPEWLLAVPLLHFLRGDSKPFEEPDVGGSPKNLQWWGAQGLRIKEFQRSDNQDFSDVWPRLASAFEVDRLLKRTFLHAIPVQDLHRAAENRIFHVSDLCVALTTFFPRGSFDREKHDKIQLCIQSLIAMLEPQETKSSAPRESVELTVSVSLTLVKTCLEILTFRNNIDTICLAIKLFFTSIQKRRLALLDIATDESNTFSLEDDAMTQLLRKLDAKLTRDLDPSMPDYCKSEALLRELQVWSKLLWVADSNQGFGDYREFLTERLARRAKRVEEKYLIEIFCEVNLDIYHRAVGEFFTKLAFEALEGIINSHKGADADHAFMTLRSSSQRNDPQAGKYGELLSMLLTKSWPRSAEHVHKTGLDPRAVEFLLTWNSMKGYLSFFGDGSGRGSILSEEGEQTLVMAKSLLEEVTRTINNASVTVEVLSLLQEHKQRFLDLLKTTVPVGAEHKADDLPSREDNTEERLAERIGELEEFQKVKAQVCSLVNMCDLIPPVNITSIKKKVPQDVSFHNICDLCDRKENNQIDVKFFEFPTAVREILPALHEVLQSSTFQELWSKFGKKAQTVRENDEGQRAHLTLSDVVNQVWKPAYECWNNLVARVMDGSSTLRDVDKHFDNFKNRKEKLEKELLTMFSLSQGQSAGGAIKQQATVEERAGQIERYQQMHQYASAAKTIWEFKEAMGFSGDFKVIEDLRNQLSPEFKQKALESIGDQFAKAGKALECLNFKQAQCFIAVVDSRRLVEWLRTTIKSTQELKVLVDLALISAGESDMETDRISSLHTSCLGFAPLIFDLRDSEKQAVSFDQLVRACEPVWKAVETDPNLPMKLTDTSRHLEWLKTIKQSHGSVALTSLVQAEAINSRGVYMVGRLETGDNSSADQEMQLSVNSVIRLTVPPKDDSEGVETKTYSLDELKDLQSKLMLIAGKAAKGKDGVDAFVKNLEGIMRLATAYVNLCESGFVHQLNWSQMFTCSKDRIEGESISEELAEASKQMETCYLNWKHKVSDARKEFQELNFFTTQQLMLLRREIAAACNSVDLQVTNLQVLTLLESVRPNLEADQLKSAIQHAFKNTDLLEEKRGALKLPSFTQAPSDVESTSRKSLFDNNNYLGSPSSSEMMCSQVQAISVKKPKPKVTSKIRSFIDAAEDAGYSEKVAIAALASLGVDAEEDDLLFWCLESADEEDIDALYEEAMSNAAIVKEIGPSSGGPQTQRQGELEAVPSKDESESIKESGVLHTLSSEFPETIAVETEKEGTPGDNEAEIGQYLTLSQLGSILRELALKGKGARNRTFPSYLKRGRPNLMLVPKDDVLATVLALYMHDKLQPLPSHDEVLICTPGTTTEEIELLWRRATGDFQGRFYCLVNADQLDFTVSKEAVEKLSVLTQGLAGKTGEHYGLVVICSSESEDRANIVAALDQFRVAAPPCPSPSDVRSYLKQKFKAPSPQYGFIGGSKITWTAAGSLDPENLSVRVVSSDRGGLGKSLVVRRLTEQLPNIMNNDMVVTNTRRSGSAIQLHVTVPLHGNSTDSSMAIDSLLPHAVNANTPLSRIFHLDVSPAMRRGLDTLLFNLLVLGVLCDERGRVWRRRSTDLYVIEVTTAAPLPTGLSKEEQLEKQEGQAGRSIMSKRPLYDLLPNIKCSTPRTVSCALAANPDPRHLNPLFDVKEFRSAHFQRVFQYLKLSYEGKSLDNFTFVPGNVDDDQKTCLTLLLRYCGIPDPSWSEIRHFVSFLNSQLRDCEQSFFCDMTLMGNVLAGPDVLNLNGFRSFVVRFMIQMSRDFATPSLTAENTLFYMDDNDELERKEIEQFVLRRSWESSPHPYLFFNQDHITMTFLGFTINTAGDLLDPKTKLVLEKGLMSKPLRNGLNAQRVDFTTNTENWTKDEKISKLCSVLGVQWVHDPDRAYELTMDNVKKILAIHMRFRCNIPVIVMGETGCGKTRLIRYMCGLQSGSGGPRNMLLVKVHGGTSYEDIKLKVEQAEEMARHNQDKDIDTVLFFDEANTTEALSMIKEVMVDRRIGGRPIGVGLHRLQFIAACNPYRRHTDEMIHKLESAGLGYHVKTDDSEDRLGHIPLRHLVYRVHALPGSMRPLIWDFGQLNPDVEELYTKQIVSRYILHEHQIPGDALTAQSVTAVLAASQKYMRDQSDECSFVSLRDVERAMQVMVWFFEHVETLGRLMKQVLKEKRREQGDDDEDSEEDSESDEEEEEEPIDPITRALVLAIGVCYHAKLQDRRQEYRTVVAKSFRPPCTLPGGQKQILREITSCQQAVLNQLTLGPNIARNTALSENVFMMVVCIELRIPLFVVGKPGSSKSLAKTVVADNMQGDAARSELFKTFKQVHMASYQCSPLSTPEGIVGTFRQCSKLQEGKSPDKFVSVVVLDEVGLAEDSPLMPLKTLHPLLEDGVTPADDVIQTDERSQRVAFIGISNWALDPAKMNRGIMLSRGVPSEGELVDSAMGICSTDKQVRNQIALLLSPLAQGYAELYKAQSNFKTLKSCGKEEFFGLRDFYSLIKMVYSIAAKSGQRPRWHQLEHAIKRNFGGLTEGEPVKIFKRHFQESEEDEAVETSTTIRLIEASLRREDVADNTNFSENRYLLILTENYAALRIMQQHLLKSADNAVVIFGSSFPNDQEYTQICRNINRIKVCMETGRTVILLNLESLYESLYDALNQYYVYLGGQKYVDLGLGSHRVKCRVHDDFKLIVIAEKDVVYNEFPIPLINRLEKHYLVTSTSLTQDQSELVEKLREWVDDFAKVQSQRKRDFVVGDAFVGYHEDTIPSIVMQVCNDIEEEEEKAALEGDIPNNPRATQVLERSQKLLIEMAAPDAIARLPATGLAGRARHIWDDYFTRQQHSSLAAFMSHVLIVDDPLLNEKRREGLFIQITTHSRLLASVDLADISNATRFHRSAVECVTLQQFQTEQQFRVSVRGFFEHLGGDSGILVVQCDSGDDNFNLIAGARHILMEERTNAPENLNLLAIEPVHILVVVQLPRVKGGCRNFVGFQGGKWMSTHIDELRPPGKHAPSIEQLTDRRISELFKSGSDDEQPDESEAILETRANAVDLLRNCVQAAACRIDDEAGSAERSTRRIELLLDLLPEDSQNLGEGTFPGILIRRTYQLLVEREDKAYQASEWLHSEAMSGTGVQEWGTFRKALWQRVYSAVVPILAEIIALADRDGNLDLIRNDSTWISTLWLKILDDANISKLHYSKILSPVTNAVRERVPVLGSGAGGHLFSCRFPFSCLIKERAEKMLKDAFGAAAPSNEKVVDSLRRLLDSSELGPLLGEIRYQHIASLTYLMDFVNMVYKPSFPGEHELICEAILSSARELGASEDETGNDLIDIPLVHVAYSRIQSRLRCFSRIVQAQPSVIQKLHDLLRKKESEVLLDVVALEICLEELTPSEETLLSPNSRRAWCDSVLAIRPAVEDMMRKDRFGAVTELNSNYGEKSKTTLTYCRSMWQRSGAVRLFVEHVAFVDENGDDSHSGNVVRLWKALGENTDFSSLRSLQTIEKFLIFCSQEVQEREDEKTASEFRRRGNAFFMELVSIFCFAEAASKDVEPDALSMLMRYVIGNQSSQTKDFSPFPDYGIDPTPVVRSFLLQQLLRSSTKLVKEHLGSFLQEAQGLKPEPEHIQEVCFLGVQCMEDALIGRYQSKIVESKLTVQIKHVKKTCEEAFKVLIAEAQASNEMSANALEGVAKGRYVLTLVADYIHKCFIEGDTNWSDLDVRREVESMLVFAERLCCEKGFSTPQLYLLKQLARRYGLDCVRTLVKYREVEWIFPPEARQQEEDVIQDRFIVHEDGYRKVREGVAKALISGNVQDITTALTSVATKDVNKEILLLLALYREVTLRNASVQQQILSDETKVKLNEFVETGGQLSVKIQPFAKQLLENSQGGQFARLRVGRDKTPLEHTLAEIVIHTSIALQCIGSGSLAQPLYLLLEDPAKLQGSYLPTMPEDNYLECIKVIQETMQGTGRVGEWYECGKCTHPYFIGECSKPMEKTKCPDCDSVLGGEAHKFLGEVRTSERKDRTKAGHALGEPGSRSTVAEPQRNMSPIVCSLLRIIMHAAMITGACRNAQVIAQMITPPVKPHETADFIWQHLQRDLDVLGRALGRSVDDAALSVHLVLQRMISLRGGQIVNSHDMQLRNRESRRCWEAEFTSAVITPVISSLDANLQKAVTLLMRDERFGKDPLVRQLYQFDEQVEDLSQGVSPMSRSLWRYRRQITVERLGHSFRQETLSGDSEHYKVLGAFLKEEHKLRAVQFLPDIVRLQRLLMDRFHRRIDKEEAEKFTVREFLQSLPREGPSRNEYNALFQSFRNAWNSCRSFLADHGRLRVPLDLCNTAMDNDCPIAMLLPSTTGMGVCSTSLTFFLVNTHDEFLGAYRSATNQENPPERVSVSDVSSSHLIAYDPERDLLPLILAHCNYSLEVGQETLVQYNWAALERQLIDRFLRGRPFVDFKDERFAFSRDTRDDAVFASLKEKIAQEPISRAIEGQIVAEFRSSLADVCNVLSSLDIAIGFLSSSGGSTDMPLTQYLHVVLRLPRERGLKSPTAEQHCMLSHTLALWRLMALERAKIMSRNKQEPFEQMHQIFKEKLSSSGVANLNRVLRRIDMDLFLPNLLEMILLNVNRAADKAGDAIAAMSFQEYWELYLEEKGLEQIPGTENIPEGVEMKHVKAVWNSAIQLTDDFHKGSQPVAA